MDPNSHRMEVLHSVLLIEKKEIYSDVANQNRNFTGHQFADDTDLATESVTGLRFIHSAVADYLSNLARKIVSIKKEMEIHDNKQQERKER